MRYILLTIFLFVFFVLVPLEVMILNIRLNHIQRDLNDFLPFWLPEEKKERGAHYEQLIDKLKHVMPGKSDTVDSEPGDAE